MSEGDGINLAPLTKALTNLKESIMSSFKLEWVQVDESNIEPTPSHGISGWGIGEWSAKLEEEHFKKVRVYQITGDQVGDDHGKWCFLIATDNYMRLSPGKKEGVYWGGSDDAEGAKEMAEKWLSGERKMKVSDHGLDWALF